ncbi:hypothetical protein FACS189442_3530 [Spirochaetia bacterium]|nr:hypothetical protein FACS189442_3530 [Spirochaetia bacterium]
MINQDYLYTRKYNDANDFTLSPDSIYIYGYSPENRSHSVVDALKGKYPNIKYIEIQAVMDEKDVIQDTNTMKKYYLRNSKSIQSLFEIYNPSAVYFDTSGLNNRISASLLKNMVLLNEKKKLEIDVIYVEPHAYKTQQFKLEGVFNDLSEKIDGIEPLPGFANIVPNTDEMKFVALLGFEGGRFTHLIERIQPPSDNIIPVVGVPGFRIEYPFVALWGNRIPLEETKSWNNIKYVAANSAVDVFLLLKKILNSMPENTKITLAPIGTKPHAIGAILFAIKYPKRVEIVYDNPKRTIMRTDGTDLIVVCNINSLLSEN